MPRKTYIGTEVAHVTRDSDITFKMKSSKVNLQGRRHIVAITDEIMYSLVFVCLFVFRVQDGSNRVNLDKIFRVV